MRLKITFESTELTIPINYQSILQGIIYNAFDRDQYGSFLHEQGYREGKRLFKMFTFSNLFGDYEVKDRTLVFHGETYFYISSLSEGFMKELYDFFTTNRQILLHKQIVKVCKIELVDLTFFRGIKEVKIKTLSPLVAYRTENNYVHYFKPSDNEFHDICKKNLIDKNSAFGHVVSQINFEIKKIEKEKKRLVKFKNTFYEAYLAEMTLSVDYETLLLIYNTGLSSKGPCGFGMIEVVK